uniref:WS_DGAT_C domain-containing protein n=1 Tax=Haemonchus placei TaxID=6290 RepID=A0A0N4WTS5_HAEPC
LLSPIVVPRVSNNPVIFTIFLSPTDQFNCMGTSHSASGMLIDY